MAWNSLPDFMRDPTSSTDCFRRLLKPKRTCSRDTSASSALGVLNDYRTRYTNPRTHSLKDGLTQQHTRRMAKTKVLLSTRSLEFPRMHMCYQSVPSVAKGCLQFEEKAYSRVTDGFLECSAG